MKTKELRRWVFTGVLAALVFAATNLRFIIPTPLGPTMLHLGNVCCILSGLILGPLYGGLAAGTGSAIFDLFDPNFAPEFWITFIMKFGYGFVVGLLARGSLSIPRKKVALAAAGGAIFYTLLYGLKNLLVLHFVAGNPMKAVLPVVGVKMGVSLGNAVVAVIVAFVVYEALGRRLPKLRD